MAPRFDHVFVTFDDGGMNKGLFLKGLQQEFHLLENKYGTYYVLAC